MNRRLFDGDHATIALGRNNMDTVVRMINLARCRDKLGRRAEALVVARDAAETAKRILPDGHPIRDKCDNLLSDLTVP